MLKFPQTMNNYFYKNSYTEKGVFLSTAGGENNWEEDQQFTEEEIKIWGLDMFEKEKVE